MWVNGNLGIEVSIIAQEEGTKKQHYICIEIAHNKRKMALKQDLHINSKILSYLLSLWTFLLKIKVKICKIYTEFQFSEFYRV